MKANKLKEKGKKGSIGFSVNLFHILTSKPLSLLPMFTESIIDANSSFIRYNKMSETSKGRASLKFPIKCLHTAQQ